MRVLRVAGDPEVRELCGALHDTLIRTRLRRQLPVGPALDILGDYCHTVRLNIGARRLVPAEPPRAADRAAIAELRLVMPLFQQRPMIIEYYFVCHS